MPILHTERGGSAWLFYHFFWQTGWDFYGHPGILDDTKSVYLTRNFCWNYRTLSQILKDSSNEIFHVTGGNFLSQEEISCHKKKFLVTGRNILWLEESCFGMKKFPVTQEISCDRKKFPVTGRNFLWGEETSVAGSNFLLEGEISCHKKIAQMKFFMSQEEISCHKKKLIVTERNCLWQEEFSFDMKKFPVTGINVCHRKKFPVTRRNL